MVEIILYNNQRYLPSNSCLFTPKLTNNNFDICSKQTIGKKRSTRIIIIILYRWSAINTCRTEVDSTTCTCTFIINPFPISSHQ